MLVAALASWAAAGFAGTQLRVIATDPPSTEIQLKPGQNYSVKIAYDTDEPIQIMARPFFQGSQVDSRSNASDFYNGSGEALGWFALTGPGEVDEVRLLVAPHGSDNAVDAGSFPVKISVGNPGQAAEPTKPAEWVTSLIEQSATRRQEIPSKVKEPSPADRLLLLGFFVAIAGLFFLSIGWPLWALFRWEGRWRMAAAVPLLGMLAMLGRLVIDVSINPASHNLWPYEMLITGAVCTGTIATIHILRRLMKSRTANAPGLPG